MTDSSTSRLRRRKKAKERLSKITSCTNSLVIHYACESFESKTSSTPRISSIAVREFQTGNTKSFVLHQCAEKLKIPTNLIHQNFDLIEKKMLHEFFQYARRQNNPCWIHWAMRDSKFGFSALEHRMEALGGSPYKVPDDRKEDLSDILRDMYGDKYIGYPRMERLLSANELNDDQFLDGPAEARAFSAGEYVSIHHSTLRKVDIISKFINLASENRLKVDTSFFQIHGLSLPSILKSVKEHWLVATILAIVPAVGVAEKAFSFITKIFP